MKYNIKLTETIDHVVTVDVPNEEMLEDYMKAAEKSFWGGNSVDRMSDDGVPKIGYLIATQACPEHLDNDYVTLHEIDDHKEFVTEVIKL